MQFLLDNPLLILAIIFLLIAVVFWVVLKPKVSKKSSKKENSVSDDKSKNITEKTDDVQTEQTISDKNESSSEEIQKKKKLRKTKPEITHVYEKKQIQTKVEQKKEIDTKAEEELLKKMQFVSSSGKISRLKPYINEDNNQNEILEFEDLTELVKPEIEEKKSRFDRSRRLSQMIKDDSFDDLFCSHISDKYLNIDIDKHIKTCDEIQEKLFQRAADTMANSESKVVVTNDGVVEELKDKESMKKWLETKRRQEIAKLMVDDSNQNSDDSVYDEILEDDLNLDSKTILVVDSILKRKGKK